MVGKVYRTRVETDACVFLSSGSSSVLGWTIEALDTSCLESVQLVYFFPDQGLLTP